MPMKAQGSQVYALLPSVNELSKGPRSLLMPYRVGLGV